MITVAVARRIHIEKNDITKLAVDAIVNAANESLLGGGGVDGAIHRAAGPELLAECRLLGRCPTGEARITKGYHLPVKHIIHTVGPVYRDGDSGEAELLRSCYIQSLILAEKHGMKSIAFPCISTGVFNYPHQEACLIAVESVSGWLAAHSLPEEVIFCCFNEEDRRLYQRECTTTIS